MKCAEFVKVRLQEKFQAEQNVYEKEQIRLELEKEAEIKKAEMWQLENERKLLEEESKKFDSEIEKFEEDERQKQDELERQRLILLYGNPDKTPEPSAPPPAYSDVLDGSTLPNIPIIPPRSTKPQNQKSEIKIIGENLKNTNPNLRVVQVPRDISTKFLALSAENNRNNIETCGLLFGVAEGDKFVITYCMLPKQTGTHDSCTTTNEEQIWKFQGNYLLKK